MYTCHKAITLLSTQVVFFELYTVLESCILYTKSIKSTINVLREGFVNNINKSISLDFAKIPMIKCITFWQK